MFQQFQNFELCQNPRMTRFEKTFFTDGNFLNRKSIIEPLEKSWLIKSSGFLERASLWKLYIYIYTDQ